MTEQIPDKILSEFRRLREDFPLFEFDEPKSRTGDSWCSKVTFAESFGYTTEVPPRRMDNDTLRSEHLSKALAKSFMDRYPDLYIIVHNSGMLLSVWVKRGDRGSESLGHCSLEGADAALVELQKIAERVKDPKWFYCNGHKKVEPAEERSYHFFAGQYCHEWKEANPKHYQDSLSQSL